MSLINWSDSMATGIPEVDEQHRRLIVLINDMHDALKAGKAHSVCLNVLKELVSYTDYHFKTEEALFQKLRYPGATLHRTEHDNLRKKAVDLVGKYEANPLGVTLEVMHFLKDWLTHHISESDKAFGRFWKDAPRA